MNTAGNFQRYSQDHKQDAHDISHGLLGYLITRNFPNQEEQLSFEFFEKIGFHFELMG